MIISAAPQPIGIGALSKRTGVNIETIRYYERIGLLPAVIRSAGGYRLYGIDEVKRLAFVRRARTLGFTLDEVRALLKLAEDPGRSCNSVARIASVHLADVRAKITDLTVMENMLEEMVARCNVGALRRCPLIDALYRESDVSIAARADTNKNDARQKRRRVRWPSQ